MCVLVIVVIHGCHSLVELLATLLLWQHLHLLVLGKQVFGEEAFESDPAKPSESFV